MRRAKPRSSSAVTPLARNAASSAPAIAGASSGVGQQRQQLPRPRLRSRSRPSSRRSSAARSARAAITHRRSRPSSRACRCQRRKLRIMIGPSGRQHALGMKLHALDVQLAVAHAHDLAFGACARSLEQPAGMRRGVGDQRVIAADLEALRHSSNTPWPSCWTGDILPCISRAARTTLPPNTSTMRLMAEADAEHRDVAGERADHRHRYTRLARRARARRDAQVRGLELQRLLDRDGIVAIARAHPRPAPGTPAPGCR